MNWVNCKNTYFYYNNIPKFEHSDVHNVAKTSYEADLKNAQTKDSLLEFKKLTISTDKFIEDVKVYKKEYEDSIFAYNNFWRTTLSQFDKEYKDTIEDLYQKEYAARIKYNYHKNIHEGTFEGDNSKKVKDDYKLSLQELKSSWELSNDFKYIFNIVKAETGLLLELEYPNGIIDKILIGDLNKDTAESGSNTCPDSEGNYSDDVIVPAMSKVLRYKMLDLT